MAKSERRKDCKKVPLEHPWCRKKGKDKKRGQDSETREDDLPRQGENDPKGQMLYSIENTSRRVREKNKERKKH